LENGGLIGEEGSLKKIGKILPPSGMITETLLSIRGTAAAGEEWGLVPSDIIGKVFSK